ncbi:MAG: hypothetical protein WA211_03530 [Candidatus Acidiferrales bacterium]
MMAGLICDCPICRLEATLVAELAGDQRREEFLAFISSRPALSRFPTALALVAHLHGSQDHNSHAFSDQILLEILGRASETAFAPLGQSQLLLVFIPTIHHTASQIVASFPGLARDDTGQQLCVLLLEYLSSQELRSRRSHLAFTVARKIRREGFRWALRESRTSLRNGTGATPDAALETNASVETAHADILLAQFLDSCERRGWLTRVERQLLLEFKLDRVSGPELARRSGHSVVAIRHRVQRLVDRLRRIAGKSAGTDPQQLKLFRS